MPDRKLLVYSRERNDKRIYGLNVYKPHFLDILATRCKADIDEAKRRVIITREGKYMYTPSKEYIQYLKKHTRKVK